MGLDMCLYKAKRPEYQKDEEFITLDWLKEKGFHCFLKESIDEYEKALLPYCKEDTAMAGFWDQRQIIIDNGYDPDKCDIDFSYSMDDLVKYNIYRRGTLLKRFTLTEDELEEKYMFESLEDVYVVKLELVNCWRKNYDLQTYIYNMFDNRINNCEYKKLSIDQVLEILNYDGVSQEKIFALEPETEDCGYFYYEWY